MKTIRANAEKILTDNMNHVNAQIDVQASANNGSKNVLFTLRTYIENEAKNNPNFYRWLFNNYDIDFHGKNMTSEQKDAYEAWFNSL
ncbi:MAG: hypothetical protein RBS38_03565 [Bacteroidales bacterium]|jgi:flavodoxin|nr:hypothetical protein [Bacteroidales bacterium]